MLRSVVVPVSAVLSLVTVGCATTPEDEIELENNAGKADGVDISIDFDQDHTFQSFAVRCDEPGGCDAMIILDIHGLVPATATSEGFQFAGVSVADMPADDGLRAPKQTDYLFAQSSDWSADEPQIQFSSVRQGSGDESPCVMPFAINRAIPQGRAVISVGVLGDAAFTARVEALWAPADAAN